MSWHPERPRGNLSTVVLIASLLTTWVSAIASQTPHALVPLPSPYYSIDRTSPTIGLVQSEDIIQKPGPSPAFTGPGLGMDQPLDEMDGLSIDRGNVNGADMFLVLFGVDRQSVGLVAPDPGLVGLNRPFNVQEQAAKNQQAADIYMSLTPFDVNGPLGARGTGNNTLVTNQGDTGGVDKDLAPEESPEKQTSGADQKDDSDAMTKKDDGTGASRGLTGFGFYYTLASFSPSLATLPGQPSGANIYFDASPTVGGNESLYAAPDDLGLVPGDDVNGLIVFDNGNSILNPGNDRILFTLAPGSPSLGLNSPADIFVSFGNGFFQVWTDAASLGLSINDNIDALEIQETDDPFQSIFDHAIFEVIPGDFDGDGDLNSFDCDQFISCWSGNGNTYDDNGFVTHMVDVGPGPVFTPDNFNIEAGDTVEWNWQDGPHNVVSGVGGAPNGAFDSGPPDNAGATFSVDFDDALMNLYPMGGGVYSYFSEPDLPGMVGSVTVESHPCAVFDQDFDGDVDCDDWRKFRNFYIFHTGGSVCMPLDVPDFVAVLLGAPVPPAHSCIADVNDDGVADGLDIQLYTMAKLIGP